MKYLAGFVIGLNLGVLMLLGQHLYQEIKLAQNVNAQSIVTTPVQTNVPLEHQNGQILVQPIHQNHRITYQIDPHQTRHQKWLWKTAIDHWNQLHVLKFQATDQQNALLKLTSDPKPQTKTDLTLAKTIIHTIDDPTNRQLSYLSKCQAVIEPKLLTNFKTPAQITACEHEIGHLLGFSHDRRLINQRPVVMNPTLSNHTQPLGAYEAKTLRQIYH